MNKVNQMLLPYWTFTDIKTEQAKLYRKHMQRFAQAFNSNKTYEFDDTGVCISICHTTLKPVSNPESYLDDNNTLDYAKLESLDIPQILWIGLWKCLKDNKSDWQYNDNFEFPCDGNESDKDTLLDYIAHCALAIPEFAYACFIEQGEGEFCGLYNEEELDGMMESVAARVYPGCMDDNTWRWH